MAKRELIERENLINQLTESSEHPFIFDRNIDEVVAIIEADKN